jgi:methyltransferase
MSLAALILAFVTLQRLAELVLARRNTLRLQAQGGYEAGSGHYPLVVVLHAAWLGGLWYLAVWHGPRPVEVPWLVLFVVLQGLRLWVLASLGGRWTTRIVIVPGAPLVARGPYRWIKHPNYCVVAGEILVLPLVFGLTGYGVGFSVLNALVLWWRIRIENKALAGRPSGRLYQTQTGKRMARDPNRFWWLKLVLIAGCCGGLWYFERTFFPHNSGLLGAVIGLVLGAFMATVYEDYIDQNSD